MLSMPSTWLNALCSGFAASCSRAVRWLRPVPRDRLANIRAQCETFLQSSDAQGALNLVDAEIEKTPEIGEFHLLRARALRPLNRWAELQKSADRALGLGYETPLVHLFRGHGLFDAGRYAEAESAYTECLRLAPDDCTASVFRALSVWKQDRIEEAEDLFDKTEAAFPNHAIPFFERGKLLYSASEYDRAATCFERASEIDPKDKSVRHWRGAAYCMLGYYDLAVDNVTDSMSMGTPSASEYRWRGEALARLQQYEDALADFRKAMELDQATAIDHDWCGWLLKELGRWEEAEQAYSEAIQLDAAVPHYFENRSKIRDQLGKDDLAAADFEICLDLELTKNPPPAMSNPTLDIYALVQSHFANAPLEQLSLVERFFPLRASPDAQRALDAIGEAGFTVDQFLTPKQNHNAVYNFQVIYTRDRRNPVTASAPLHYEVDIGEEKPVRCLWTGAWLLTHRETRFAVLTTTDQTSRRFQVAAPATAEGEAAIHAFFAYVEQAIAQGACYRGKVLSLEEDDDYTGTANGIKVHRLRNVSRDDVILPGPTLALLDRNVIEFVKARPRLRDLRLATKKGLLFHGPPGTGKTHTIHYLTRALPGTTTLLIAAEQVGRLAEYMTLARMYQPSLVVIEDVDLIARERRTLRSGMEETLLNRLLNEMDGLKPDADILFVLTTNAPDALEEALASRPGRVDQAIEFPYPDAEGRGKLTRMYAGRLAITDEIVERIASRPEPMSPAFIKELMRRAAQSVVMREETALTLDDVDRALEEMFYNGLVNANLFGFRAK
jgi:cell division protease FtsH